jgi:ferredoxin--NADP+ reductase
VDWLTYIPTVSRPWDAPDWKGEIGRVDEIVRKYADQLGFTAENTVAYACGNPTMITNVQGITKRMRFSEEQFKEEKYYSVKTTA